jgi:hypothetical protein
MRWPWQAAPTGEQRWILSAFGFARAFVVTFGSPLPGFAGGHVPLVGRVRTDGDRLMIRTAVAPFARFMMGTASQSPPAVTFFIPANEYQHEQHKNDAAGDNGDEMVQHEAPFDSMSDSKWFRVDVSNIRSGWKSAIAWQCGRTCRGTPSITS